MLVYEPNRNAPLGAYLVTVEAHRLVGRSVADAPLASAIVRAFRVFDDEDTDAQRRAKGTREATLAFLATNPPVAATAIFFLSPVVALHELQRDRASTPRGFGRHFLARALGLLLDMDAVADEDDIQLLACGSTEGRIDDRAAAERDARAAVVALYTRYGFKLDESEANDGRYGPNAAVMHATVGRVLQQCAAH
jgi:hypothetical protein